ncbi:MAG: hypothetical protein ABIG89_04405 [Candidatus Woesearchaeota archaeon]
MKTLKKRGDIEVQFNWIFIFIVGTIILLFFVSAGKTYLHNSEIKLASRIMFDLDSIMRGATASTKSATKLEIPKLEMRFTCFPDCSEEGCSSDFSMGDTGVNKQTPHQVIFTSEHIESDYLITWSLDWTVPFKVGNLLYLTSPAIKYVLVYNDPVSEAFANKVYNLMLDNEFLTVEIKAHDEFADVADLGHEKIRFVFFYQFGKDDIKVDPELFEKGDFDVVVLEPVFEGNAMFFTKDEVKNGVNYATVLKYGYYGKETLMGAIFSENADFYKCSMEKSFNHLNRLFDIYRERASYLSQHVLDNPKYSHCSQIYEGFASLPKTPIKYLGQFTANNLIALKNINDIAANTNQNAVLNSCPKLY